MKSYQDLLRAILTTGRSHRDRTGVGTTSAFGLQWEHDLALGFPLLTTKRLPFRWIAEELFWFLSGSTNECDLAARGVDIWREWATEEKCRKFDRFEGDLGPVYGSLWRSFPVGRTPADDIADPPATVDQIRQLCDDLRDSPNSRRLIVTGWHPFYAKRVELPPCHTLFQIKVEAAESGPPELSLKLYARSIDSFLGLPFNIASYALLLSLLAATHAMVPRRLIVTFGDVHIYSNHLEQVTEQLSRAPGKLPTLAVSERIAGRGFDGLVDCRYEDLRLIGYDPQGKIAAPVAV